MRVVVSLSQIHQPDNLEEVKLSLQVPWYVPQCTRMSSFPQDFFINNKINSKWNLNLDIKCSDFQITLQMKISKGDEILFQKLLFPSILHRLKVYNQLQKLLCKPLNRPATPNWQLHDSTQRDFIDSISSPSLNICFKGWGLGKGDFWGSQKRCYKLKTRSPCRVW